MVNDTLTRELGGGSSRSTSCASMGQCGLPCWTRVLTNREHIIALKPLEKGLVATFLRYPYEVRSEERHFDEIPDVV